MDHADILAVKALTDICESRLAFQVAQVKAIELAALRFQNIERVVFPGGPACGQSDALSLSAALARIESDQERIETYVSQLRVYLKEKGIG
jgi:hypothetical protein